MRISKQFFINQGVREAHKKSKKAPLKVNAIAPPPVQGFKYVITTKEFVVRHAI